MKICVKQQNRVTDCMDDIYKDMSAVASERQEGILTFGFESVIGITITPAIREGH